MYKTMKKAYIEPKNTVVEILVETIIAESIPNGGMKNGVSDAREVVFSQESINSPDAWEEW